MRKRIRIALRIAVGVMLAGAVAGFLWPQRAVVPVQGATERDWNPESFWYYPWGRSAVHKGIDIFASEGTAVVSATPGLVMYAGPGGTGGNVVAVLGPKWRVHYYAHLRSIGTVPGAIVDSGETIGAVGATGNAVGKPPHLHYSIVTPVPYPWLFKCGRQGWKRMFYLDPGKAIASQVVNPAATSRGSWGARSGRKTRGIQGRKPACRAPVRCAE